MEEAPKSLGFVPCRRFGWTLFSSAGIPVGSFRERSGLQAIKHATTGRRGGATNARGALTKRRSDLFLLILKTKPSAGQSGPQRSCIRVLT